MVQCNLICQTIYLKYDAGKDVCQFKHFNATVRRFNSTVNFVENNEIITTSHIQKFSTCVTMNKLLTNNGLQKERRKKQCDYMKYIFNLSVSMGSCRNDDSFLYFWFMQFMNVMADYIQLTKQDFKLCPVTVVFIFILLSSVWSVGVHIILLCIPYTHRLVTESFPFMLLLTSSTNARFFEADVLNNYAVLQPF